MPDMGHYQAYSGRRVLTALCQRLPYAGRNGRNAAESRATGSQWDVGTQGREWARDRHTAAADAAPPGRARRQETVPCNARAGGGTVVQRGSGGHPAP